MHDIAFCGFICSGKTHISKELQKKHGGRIESIATPLKNFAQELLNTISDGLLPNYQKVKKPEHRNFLVFIGEILRDPNFSYQNFWIEKVNVKKRPGEFVYIDDVRHPNEAFYMKANGFVIVRLDVSEQEQIDRAIARDGGFDSSIRKHHSEISHLNIKPDIIIDTNGKTPEKIIEEIEKQITPLLKLKIKLRSYSYKLLTKIK